MLKSSYKKEKNAFIIFKLFEIITVKFHEVLRERQRLRQKQKEIETETENLKGH